MSKITLVSLNCFDASFFGFSLRRERLNALAHHIIKLSPDVVCLQEINFRDTTSQFKHLFQNAGYTVFPDKFSFRIFNPGGLFTASKLPVVSATYKKFNQQGKWLALDFFERLTKRGYHRIVVKTPGHNTVTIINTHLHYSAGGFYSEEASPLSLMQYQQIISQEHMKKQSIFTGDLNILSTNRLYKLLTSTLHDPLTHSSDITISPHNTNRRHFPKSKGRIDYTLVSGDLISDTTQKIILNQPVKLTRGSSHHLSDHFGVWTEIQFR